MDGGDVYMAMGKCLMPNNCTLNNGENCKFYVYFYHDTKNVK